MPDKTTKPGVLGNNIIYLSGCLKATEVQTSNTNGKDCPRKCLNQEPFMFAVNINVKVIPLYFCGIFTLPSYVNSEAMPFYFILQNIIP